MYIYHYSEEANLEKFVPRPSASSPKGEALVWAVDEEHSPLYLLPRDCPRVAFWPLPATTPEDCSRFLTGVSARMVIAVEWGRLQSLLTARLYRYRMPLQSFSLLEPTDSPAYYGVYVSRETVFPEAVEEAGSLLEAQQQAGAELRFVPNLFPLQEALVASTMHFSCIRMRNAVRPAGEKIG